MCSSHSSHFIILKRLATLLEADYTYWAAQIDWRSSLLENLHLLTEFGNYKQPLAYQLPDEMIPPDLVISKAAIYKKTFDYYSGQALYSTPWTQTQGTK